MGKDRALGHDPLNWMKVVKEGKKSISLGDVHATDQNTTKNDPQSNSPITANQQISVPASGDKTPHIPKLSQIPDKIDKGAGNTAEPKQRVVIGRLYEKPSAEKIKSIPHTNDGVVQGASPYIESSLPVYRRVQPIQRNEPEINRVPFSLPPERISTYIIVAYTALLLVLGYFVYNDLSKRTSRIEARLFAVEKALRLKQH
ncbi:MAG: hypothetical protein HS132_00490 [Planctomycetia bacterium]|nr:hypothetical protein [Planctomycetia bacterium]